MSRFVLRSVLIAGFLAATLAMSTETLAGRQAGPDNLVDQILSDCSKKDSLSCFKRKLFSYVDKALGDKDSYSLGEGVEVVKVESDAAPRSIDEKSENIEDMFLGRFERFMRTHTFKFDVKGSDVLGAFSNAANSLGLLPNEKVEEARGKKKKAVKLLLPLLLAMKLKLATLLPIAVGAIALIAKKALIVGKIALILSVLIGLKKLLGNQQKSVTYEIVSHPHHTNHDLWAGGDYGSSGNGGGGHGGGGWGRSIDDAHNMAYQAYQPQN